jgi:hypothetical protein
MLIARRSLPVGRVIMVILPFGQVILAPLAWAELAARLRPVEEVVRQLG